jgi:hypothetical protein
MSRTVQLYENLSESIFVQYEELECPINNSEKSAYPIKNIFTAHTTRFWL